MIKNEITDLVLSWLPCGYGDRLNYIAAETGIPVSNLVRMALEDCYIMSDEQRDELEKPLPF